MSAAHGAADAGPTVVAVGGNALLRRGGPHDAGTEHRNAAVAAAAIARLGHAGGLVVTHGNGPQVGALALGAEAIGHHEPMAVLVAESQGHVGHLLHAALAASLAPGNPVTTVTTVLTHVEVDPADEAFARPSKPIGAMLDEPTARALAAAHGWSVAPDGDGWRRVVASPRPVRIGEVEQVRSLAAPGRVVLCCGGGGIPVLRRPDGGWDDAEAVVDKDLTSALLAVELDAERLVILTDVDAVERGHRTPAAAPIASATVAEMGDLVLDAGTMGPKVDAACRFVEATGRPAHIGAIGRADAVAAGRAGTTVVP